MSVVVDLITQTSSEVSVHRDVYVVEMAFEHENDEITENLEAVFPASQKADVIKFINFLWESNPEVQDTQAEPEEVEGYEKFCNYSAPEGLHGWPSDHNGNTYANLTDVYVAYYDSNGIRYGVYQKKEE